LRGVHGGRVIVASHGGIRFEGGGKSEREGEGWEGLGKRADAVALINFERMGKDGVVGLKGFRDI